jgi:hypothetical protein
MEGEIPEIFRKCSIYGVYRVLDALMPRPGRPPTRNVSEIVRESELGRSQVLKYLKFAVGAGLAGIYPPVIHGTAAHRFLFRVYDFTRDGSRLWSLLKDYDESRFTDVPLGGAIPRYVRPKPGSIIYQMQGNRAGPVVVPKRDSNWITYRDKKGTAIAKRRLEKIKDRSGKGYTLRETGPFLALSTEKKVCARFDSWQEFLNWKQTHRRSLQE